MFYDKQKGFSLVELMVGLVIGLLAIYATYRIYENVEANQRVAETVNDAQISGLYAIFTLEQEIGNAGAIIANTPNRNAFVNCTAVNTFPDIIADGDTATGALPLFPAPVAIENTDNANFDIVHVYYGTSSNFMPLPINGTGPGFNELTVQAPLGVGVEGGERESTLVVGANPTSPSCRAYRVNGVSGTTGVDANNMAVPDGNGMVTLALDASTATIGLNASVLDLGVVGRRSFYVDGNETLQMAIWQTNNAVTATGNDWSVQRVVPIVPNVAFFRAQYGVDSDNDGVINAWMNASDASGPDALTLAELFTNNNTSRGIKSIRVAVIVRADQPDKELAGTDDFKTTVFEGGGAGASPITGLSFVVDGGAFGWRYRQYETIIPLLNTIWN